METSNTAGRKPTIVVREPDAATKRAPQNNQLMSERGILSLKPDLRLEQRRQHGQDKPDEPDHRGHLADSSFNWVFGTHTLEGSIDQEIAWYVLPAYAENANKKVRYLSVAFGASSPPALLFFRFAFLSSSSHSSSSIILTTLIPMPMSPCIRNSTPRFCR